MLKFCLYIILYNSVSININFVNDNVLSEACVSLIVCRSFHWITIEQFSFAFQLDLIIALLGTPSSDDLRTVCDAARVHMRRKCSRPSNLLSLYRLSRDSDHDVVNLLSSIFVFNPVSLLSTVTHTQEAVSPSPQNSLTLTHPNPYSRLRSELFNKSTDFVFECCMRRQNPCCVNCLRLSRCSRI